MQRDRPVVSAMSVSNAGADGSSPHGSAVSVMIVIGCNLFEWGTFLRRIDNFLMDLVTEPARVEALLEALMERHLASLEKVCRYVGDVADIVRFGDDGVGYEHWGVFDAMGMMQQLGVVPAGPPA